MIPTKGPAQAVLCTLQLALACFVLSPSLLAQGSEKPALSVADVSADTAHEVVVPIQVSGLEDVVRMELKVQFPSNILSFLEVRAPMSENGTVASANLETAGAQGNVSILSIAVDSDQPIASGTPVEVVFNPSNEIFENQSFLVSIREASLERAGGERIVDLDLKDGRVVIVIPLFSCFFYMH